MEEIEYTVETEEVQTGEAGESTVEQTEPETPPVPDEDIEQIKRDYEQSRTIIDKILKSSGAASIDELREKMEEAEYRAALKSGMTPEAAKLFAKQQEEMRNLRDMKLSADYAEQIASLRQLPFYSDIDAVKEQVTGFARAKRISVREAYGALFADVRAQSIREEAMRAGEEAARQKQSKKIAALSSGGNAPASGGAVLTPAEAWAAKTAGIEPAEYLKFKKTKI